MRMKPLPTEKELWALLEQQVEAGEFTPETQSSEPLLSSDPDFVFEFLRTSLAEALVRAMEESGLNENQLAKKLGVSRQSVNEVLNMTTNMTLKSLAKFCVALNRQPALALLAPGERFLVSPAFHPRIVPVPQKRNLEKWDRIKDDEPYNPSAVGRIPEWEFVCPDESRLSA